MKIQCACGAKYAFDIQPDMLNQPVRFVCPSCGLDWSAFVNNLVRQELGVAAPTVGNPPATTPAVAIALPPETVQSPAAETAPVEPPAPSPPRVRLHTSSPKPAVVSAVVCDSSVCSRHYGQPAVEFCRVCRKPICAKCMELFGYVCSPMCKQKAELSGIKVPEFVGQRDVIQRRFWRKVNFASAGIGAFVVFLLAVWFWYEWFGQTPKPVFSIRFAEPAYSGQSVFAGTDQIVFLHGGKFARHDLKTKKEIWSRELIDPAKIERQVAETIESLRKAQQKLDNDYPDADPIKIPSPEKLTRSLTRGAAEELELYVRGQNVWLSSYEKVVRYDWDTGKPVQEIPLRGGLGGALARGDEMWLIRENQSGQAAVTRLNLATGQMQTDGIGVAISPTATLAGSPSTVSPGSAAPAGGRKPLDPDKVAAQAQRLPLPARIALPATLSVGVNQERALTELSGSAPGAAAAEPDYSEHFELMPTQDGFVQFSVQLLERKMVERSAMRAAPGKSALDGPVSVTATAEIANEILNEMQRERGGSTVTEDQSRYQITVRIPGAGNVPDWKGEVIGSPGLYPLKTVNVIAAGKALIVLDKSNKKKWDASLTYEISDGAGSMTEADAPYGLGPVVERDGSLFAIDEGVLTAFDLATGNARWRLPSVGIEGLFFDAGGNIYVNSTTAGPDRIKFSRQIDITERVNAVVLKIDSKSGKILWTAEPGGRISHVAGKNIFCINWYQPEENEEDNLYMPDTGFETPPYMRIKRINPRNGRIMWEHFQQRAPLDVQFEGNTIRLVFKKEVQVLRFRSL
jgi:hypothetical protein